MSEYEEDSSLLANVDEISDVEDDQSAAMRQMMGFSAFGGAQKPKRQPKVPGSGMGFGTGANSQPVQPRAASSAKPVASVLSATSHPFVPASLPPRLRKQGIPTTPPGVYSEVATTVTIPTVEVTALSTPSDFGKREDPPFGSRWRGGFAKYDRSETESSLPTIPLPVERTTQHDHDLESIGYVNSKTGYSLTKRELQAYERGVIEQVMNNDGSLGQVKVYFKPNFIDDNPWEDLEIAAGLRAKK